jgi:hypothetical protein
MTTVEEGRQRGPWQVKVYLVCQVQNLVPAGTPNVQIIDAKLTRAGAEEIRRKVPGTYIVRMFATK